MVLVLVVIVVIILKKHDYSGQDSEAWDLFEVLRSPQERPHTLT